MGGAIRRRVLVTGACGYVAAQLLPRLRERYDLMLVDARETDRDGRRVDGVVCVDLGGSDRTVYEHLFRGIDVVVHLGYRHPGAREWGADLVPIERFETEFENIRMAQNMYRCAYDAGVRRVVVASSNHAANWFEHAPVGARRREMVYPDDLPLSDNFYGWSKACVELLGFVYASGGLGRRLEVVLIRIGAPRDVAAQHNETEDARPASPAGAPDVAAFARDLGAYVSPRDLCQLFERSIDTPDITDDHGVPWLVVYGISDNARAFWSLANARRVLGYAPEDDSEVKYARDVRRLLTDPDAGTPGGRVGG